MHKVNICSHGVFLTWDLELSIQQSASMVTPEKPPGKARNASGRVETSLDDYGIPRDCVVGSPPSRLEDSRFYKYIQLTWHCPVTGPLWLRTMVTLHLCTESGINPIPIWVIVMALMVIKNVVSGSSQRVKSRQQCRFPLTWRKGNWNFVLR